MVLGKLYRLRTCYFCIGCDFDLLFRISVDFDLIFTILTIRNKINFVKQFAVAVDQQSSEVSKFVGFGEESGIGKVG